MSPLDSRKADLDVQKLEAEIAQLRLPWWKKPSYLGVFVPVGLATLTLLGAVFTGYFSAERIRLQNEKSGLQIKISALSEEKSDLQMKVSALSEEKSDLQMKVSALSEEKSDLQMQISALGEEKSDLQMKVDALRQEGIDLTNHFQKTLDSLKQIADAKGGELSQLINHIQSAQTSKEVIRQSERRIRKQIGKIRQEIWEGERKLRDLPEFSKDLTGQQ